MKKVFEWIKGYRYYNCVISGYGSNKTYNMVLYNRTKEEAKLKAEVLHRNHWGADYLISNIDVYKVSKP